MKSQAEIKQSTQFCGNKDAKEFNRNQLFLLAIADIQPLFLSFLGNRELGFISLVSVTFYNAIQSNSVLNEKYLFWCKNGPEYTLSVSLFDKNVITIKAFSKDTIFHLKEKIEMQKGTTAFQQRLFTSGRTLVDEKKVGDYKLADNDIIHMRPALRGD